MREEEKTLAHRFHMEIFQEGNLDAADEILSPDFVWHSPDFPPEWLHGPEGTKQIAMQMINGLPDRQITHDDVIAEGEEVMIRWTMTGTQTGEMMGIPATGKAITVTGFDLFRIQDGKIVEMWQNLDMLGMMRQLGVVPSAEATEGEPGEYIDPVDVAGDHYRVLLENERVRVLEMDLKAGEIDEWHSHPSETVYFIRGGKAKIHLRDGDALEAEPPDGHVMWHGPWTHRVENVGATDIYAIIVESKR